METRQALKFSQLPGLYVIIRQDFNSPVPGWAMKDEFVSITRTADELSIVCPADHIPKEFSTVPRWICLKIEGPFAFTQTGVLLSFIEPLSSNAVPIFAISTYDTDYVLIPQEHIDPALMLLREAGHELIKQ
ncbi:MAG TPA: ACT domain-containing protein [Candidatus Sulfotelmatobacter sp.]|nr:ACT domain-containing protein [Candidatus Sulfotelmatobacter sp.]